VSVLAAVLLLLAREEKMNSSARMRDERADERKGYRVEVSGWDADERFFVEKSILVWTESEGKKVALKALIRTGSVLFVRLIQPMGGGSSFPVPYKAVEFEAGNRGSGTVVMLEQLKTQMAFREAASQLISAEQQLA
jgi:hypothetical protein